MNLTSTPTVVSYNSPVQNTAEYNWTAGLLSFVIFLSLFGNGLVILAFYRFVSLRTMTNHFVVSLAVADILVASLSMPCWMYITLTDMAEIPKDVYVSTILYRSWQFVDILCSAASIINLCMISVDRHLAINSPLSYRRRMTRRRVIGSIAFAWLFAFFFASVSIITVVKSIMPTAGRVYGIFISFVAFFIPLFVLIAVYSQICRVALHHIHQITAANPRTLYGVQREHTATFRRELKVTKTLGMVVGAFVLCWGPFFTVVVFYAVCPKCPEYRGWVSASKWLHYANSTLNPLIYMLFTRTFRSAFRRLLIQSIFCKRQPQGRFNMNALKSRATVQPSEVLSRRVGAAELSEMRSYENTKTPTRPCELPGTGEISGKLLHLAVP